MYVCSVLMRTYGRKGEKARSDDDDDGEEGWGELCSCSRSWHETHHPRDKASLRGWEQPGWHDIVVGAARSLWFSVPVAADKTFSLGHGPI